MFQNSNHTHSYNLRGSNSSLFLPRPNTEYGRKCFRYSGVKIWNSIPEQVRNSESLNSFNRNISSVSLTNQLFDYCTICFVICILYSQFLILLAILYFIYFCNINYLRPTWKAASVESAMQRSQVKFYLILSYRISPCVVTSKSAQKVPNKKNFH